MTAPAQDTRSPQRPTALVVGASGIAGSAIVEQLTRTEDWDVLALSRNPVPGSSARHLGADQWSVPQEDPTIAGIAEPRGESTLNEAVEHFRRELIRRRLRSYKGNLSATAASLVVDKGNFHRMVKRIGLR